MRKGEDNKARADSRLDKYLGHVKSGKRGVIDNMGEILQ